MTFPERVVYQKALQMYKTIHCDAPDYLTTSFTFTSEIHSRLIRSYSTYHLYTPRPRHEIFGHSLKCLGASVPVNSQNASNTNSSTVYISGGSEILPHNCIIQCYTDYRKYIVYTKNVNSMS